MLPTTDLYAGWEIGPGDFIRFADLPTALGIVQPGRARLGATPVECYRVIDAHGADSLIPVADAVLIAPNYESERWRAWMRGLAAMEGQGS
jgi:hypothetical protein